MQKKCLIKYFPLLVPSSPASFVNPPSRATRYLIKFIFFVCSHFFLKCISFFRFLPPLRRILPAAVRVLPGVDLPGCAVLHREHHASVHHFRRSIPVAAVPDAIRAEQDPETGGTENQLRVAAIDCDESAIKPNVLAGKYATSCCGMSSEKGGWENRAMCAAAAAAVLQNPSDLVCRGLLLSRLVPRRFAN